MRILLTAIMLAIFSCTVQAEIAVKVEPSQVHAGESFRLILSQTPQYSGGLPDLTPLQGQFTILGTERSINYSVINGQAQSSSQWIITLKPLKSGILTIPAVAFGTEQSSPVTINVEAATAKPQTTAAPDNQQEVALTTAADKNKVYVNQEIVYTVKLYNSKRLLDVNYQGPQVDDALIIPLGDAKRYQTVLDNTNYIVEEQSYAIYPQKSGSLKIASPVFSALIYGFDPQQIKVRDKDINISVQPIPKNESSTHWLPARLVKLSERYENTAQSVTTGSTVTRTITIQGIGIPAQLLPTLDFSQSDAFQVYPEKGSDNNQIKQGNLVGSTEVKVTYLFNKTGKITIPELRLPWFNTETGTNEVAVLAPRSMDITAAQAPDEAQASVPKLQPEQSDVTIKKTSSPWPWLVAVLFALAWLATLGLWFWQKRVSYLNKHQDKSAINKLSRACHKCDPEQARDALLMWARLHWPDASILNINDLNQLVRDPLLKKQIHLLSQVLYQRGERALWRGDELLNAVLAVKKSKAKKSKKNTSLPPINPL